MMYVIIGLLGGFFVAAIMEIYDRQAKRYFNSKAKSISDKGFCPEFEVDKIEFAIDDECNAIAKYTVINCFKKDDKDFQYQKFYFYDKVDAYKVGDKLTINKLK